jgi:hypothetical protein
MTIYKLTDEMLSKYKNKYGENVCGANVLDLFGFPETTIEKLLEYRGINFEWDDMVNVINNHDSKIKNKIWLNPEDQKKTTKVVYDYNKGDNGMNNLYLQFITEELKNGTYKIIGIAAETWGHYMVIGKNSNGEILTFDPQTQKIVTGFDSIIDDFNDDNIKKIISYSNGLLVDLTAKQGGSSKRYKKKKTSRRKKTSRKKKTYRKKKTSRRKKIKSLTKTF